MPLLVLSYRLSAIPKILRLGALGCLLMLSAPHLHAQWIKQNVDTTASLRGLSVVNEKVVWASGTGGTVIRTTDGGKTWNVMAVPGAKLLDFRDVEAFDANTAFILSIGNGESSRIYQTTNGGRNWIEQFRNKNEKAFFDAIACWDRKNCIAMSDPVDGKFVLINTTDGGANWRPMDTEKMPPAKEGEAAFAASGTCLITQGKNNAFLVTGGTSARVFRSNNRGLTWLVADTPINNGTAGSGIFSISMYDNRNGAIIGGNYEKPTERLVNFAVTTDGGKTWKASGRPNGYRSSITHSGKSSFYAVGPTGSDKSNDRGKTWERIDQHSYNTIVIKDIHIQWAVGEKGMVANLPFLTMLFTVEPK